VSGWLVGWLVGAGALVGAMLPYWFGALTMGAVNKAAQAVVVTTSSHH
jgi:Na+/H+-translocating membrane pyrophosphatase